MSVTARPVDDRIIVKREDAKEATEGGIILPDAAKGKPSRGVVMAVGPGRLLNDGSRAGNQVKVGDTIVFQHFAGAEVELDDETYVVMGESDVLCVV